MINLLFAHVHYSVRISYYLCGEKKVHKEKFEVLTAALMRIQVFWTVTQCGQVNS